MWATQLCSSRFICFPAQNSAWHPLCPPSATSHADAGEHLHPSLVSLTVHKCLHLDRRAEDRLPVSLPAANPLIYRIITEIKSITETLAEMEGDKSFSCTLTGLFGL